MGIVRFPATRASKPMSANNSTTATSGTYYTLLDITSGSGFLSRLIANNTSPLTANIVQFRVTVDGIADTVIPSDDYGSNKSYAEVFTNSRFNYTLKIEVRQNTGSTYGIDTGCDYILEI